MSVVTDNVWTSIQGPDGFVTLEQLTQYLFAFINRQIEGAHYTVDVKDTTAGF